MAGSGTTPQQHTLVAETGTTQHILTDQANVSHLVPQTRTSGNLVSDPGTNTRHLVSGSGTTQHPLLTESSNTLPIVHSSLEGGAIQVPSSLAGGAMQVPGSLEGGAMQVSSECEVQTLTSLEPIGATLTVSDNGELTLCTEQRDESHDPYTQQI